MEIGTEGEPADVPLILSTARKLFQGVKCDETQSETCIYSEHFVRKFTLAANVMQEFFQQRVNRF